MSLLKKPVVLAISLAVAAAALYWFWPSAEPAGAGQAAAGKPGPGQRPAGQRPGGARPAMANNPWAMPVPVRVIEAGSTDLKVQIKAIGTVTPLNTVLVLSLIHISEPTRPY